MVVSALALVVATVGVLLYLLASNSKTQEIGRLMFFCGLLALMLTQGQRTFKIF